MKKISFNSVSSLGEECQHIERLLSDYDMLREKYFSQLCLGLLQVYFPQSKLFLTHSGTGAIEMIALLLNIKEGDEIIMPSYTFVSTANAFVSKGAVPVFVDIDPATLNINEQFIEEAITGKTKAIIAVHYAGHACKLSSMKAIAEKHGLYLIEDAAMGFGSTYGEKALGSYGDFGIVSFDVTKQISAIQGGLLIVNHEGFADRASALYHIGTNREKFMNQQVPYYEWVDKGSKYQLNELNAAVLYENLKNAAKILKTRNQLSLTYYEQLKPVEALGLVKLMKEERLSSNYHEFYLLLKNKKERLALSKFLAEKGIEALFHYIPLHLSSYGKENGRYIGGEHTKHISDTLLRLPLHIKMSISDVHYVAKQVKLFFDERK